jgi:hypothetical protein
MKRIRIVVEGQTEEKFVKEILEPHFFKFNIYPIPYTVITKETPNAKYTGGYVSYSKLYKQIMAHLRDKNAVAITTMFDFYKLPDTFPGKKDSKLEDCYEKVTELENQFSDSISRERFIPYIQLHEFESLLFSSPAEIACGFKNEKKTKAKLNRVLEECKKPELINEGEITHPSMRLKSICLGYDKSADGIIIAKRIGLTKMREECPHFNEWISKLEKLASS